MRNTIRILALSGVLYASVGAASSQEPAGVAKSAQPAVPKLIASKHAVKPKKKLGFMRRMLEPVTELQTQSIKLQEQIIRLERPIEMLQAPIVDLSNRC